MIFGTVARIFPHKRHRSRAPLRLLALLFVLAASGCVSSVDSSITLPASSTTALEDIASTGSTSASGSVASSTVASSAVASSAEASRAESATEASADAEPPEAEPAPHGLAVADTELAPAPIGFENIAGANPAGPIPTSIVIEDINVDDAEIIPVGVNEDLTFEVPPAEQVGWYEFGSSPGEAGSAVLAAHIAYNGVDGVFRYLEDVEIGAIVVVGFDDGTSRRYQIEGVTEYVKEALPDSLFARDGNEQLALITCGGAFDHDLRSYESNTVAVAVPLD